MKKVLLLITFIASFTHGYAQNSKVRYKNIFAEMFGNGYAPTLNYDTRTNPKSNKGFGFRVGVGFISATYDVNPDIKTSRITLPVTVNYLFGDGKQFLEVGAGFTTHFFEKKYFSGVSLPFRNIFYAIVPSVGYRFQSKNGILLRLNYTPHLFRFNNPEPKNYTSPRSLGLSVGYAF